MRTFTDQITPREYETWSHEKDILEMNMAHAKQMKSMELEGMRIEAKITAWFKIPLVIITLPVRILAVIPITVYAITHQEVPEFLRKLFI